MCISKHRGAMETESQINQNYIGKHQMFSFHFSLLPNNVETKHPYDQLIQLLQNGDHVNHGDDIH